MLQYYFEEILKCEMCGDSTKAHKVLGQRLNQSQGLSPKMKSGISVSVKQCSKCELIYSSPQPIPFDIQDHYGIPPEEYWIPSYFQWSPDNFANEIEVAKQLLSFKAGMKALDIGAGIGKTMISLEKAGFETYGFEASKPFYEKAVSEMNISTDRLRFGTIENIDYPEHTFDFITFGAVLEHLYHPAASLEKALRWAKQGGIIHIEVPSSKYLMSKLINIYYKLRGTNYVTHISPMHPPFHLYEFNLKSFEELSKRLNFSIVKSDYYVCAIEHVPKFLHPILRYYMKRTNTGMQLVVWLRK